MPKLTVGTEKNEAVELYYEDHGSGRPVVLIHGWPLSGRSWEKQVPALVDGGFRAITYDRRGFGQSSQPWDGYDYDTLTADLHALIEHLDLRDAALVGFSMGGGEVVRYISTHGTERVSRAVLAAAVPPYLYKTDDNPEGGLDDATIEQFRDGVKGDRLAFLDDFATMFFSPSGLKGIVTDLVSEPFRLYNRDIAAFASPKGTLDCIDAFARTDFRADLDRVSVPTLIIHGDSDKTVPFEVSGKRSHESIPGSRLVLIEGGPHGLNATHADEFNAALLDFLRA
jgi:non-heme chloroperoxidase